MSESITQIVQNAASGKTALGVAAGTASAPAWIEILNGDYFQALVVLIGVIVSLSIIFVNIQTFRVRSAEARVRARQEELRVALLEKKAKDEGIEI